VADAALNSPLPLTEALSYSNPKIARYHAELYKLSEVGSVELFEDVKQWLWACALRSWLEKSGESVPTALTITPELMNIDSMWHTFLLFTEDYQYFCSTYLKTFVHHDPIAQEEKESFRELIQKNPIEAKELRKKEMRPQLEFLYRHLGEATLTRWFLKPATCGT
jgi:pSer/pThr/pTyr-binding forkhead associated (FHA) protein